MDSSIASRLKQTPRFLAVRTPQQLQVRLQSMTPHQIWNAMTQRGLAGWKHKLMSDELERRKRNALRATGLFPFLQEV
jgi:hypothetical protein